MNIERRISNNEVYKLTTSLFDIQNSVFDIIFIKYYRYYKLAIYSPNKPQ
jgi:hypothetical protein